MLGGTWRVVLKHGFSVLVDKGRKHHKEVSKKCILEKTRVQIIIYNNVHPSKRMKDRKNPR